MITITTIIYKCVDESNARFDMMLKETIDHEDGKARMLQDFERTTVLEQVKADQDQKVTASAFLTGIESTKQDDLDSYAAAIKVNVKSEDDSPSHNHVQSAPHGLNPDGEPKRLSIFLSIDEPVSSSSKQKFQTFTCLNGIESSTHLMKVKIDGDAIKDVKKNH